MLATLRNIFSPAAIVKTLTALPPMATTIMDSYFKNRPTHPLPMLGLADLQQVAQTVPLVRRDGTPVSLAGESFEAQFIAPLPVKVKVNVSASELNDLRALLEQPQAVEAWRQNKIEHIRMTSRNTTEAICSVVLNLGKVSWPVQLEGGRNEVYEVDYGPVQSYTPAATLTAASSLSALFNLLQGMAQKIQESGLGGRVEFLAGADVASVLMDIVNASMTTTGSHPYRLELSEGKIMVGAFVIRFMYEKYPSPTGAAWVDKLASQTLLAVAADQPGTVYYCAIDSISAKNAAVPMHIVPVARDDDSGITLIGQTKPLPVRPSRAACKCIAVN
ncbi:MAG: major capsid protein [Desulfarculales bacterium]|jgi:hypothetical protein|nr:major capsid protein [Desulfarculales bacterium]